MTLTDSPMDQDTRYVTDGEMEMHDVHGIIGNIERTQEDAYEIGIYL